MSRNGYRSMIVVALTADVCEEFLFRGFVTWYFLEFWPGSRIGLVLAVISAIPFGFAHIYFGVWQVWMSAVVGVFFAAVVLAAGSLLPSLWPSTNQVCSSLRSRRCYAIMSFWKVSTRPARTLVLHPGFDVTIFRSDQARVRHFGLHFHWLKSRLLFTLGEKNELILVL